MTILPKVFYRFKYNKPQNFNDILHRNRISVSEIYVKAQKTFEYSKQSRVSQKRNTGDSTTSELKVFYRTIRVCVWVYIFINAYRTKCNMIASINLPRSHLPLRNKKIGLTRWPSRCLSYSIAVTKHHNQGSL